MNYGNPTHKLFTNNREYTCKGAKDEDLKWIRAHCLPEIQVKAAGGIRTLSDILRVKELGVTRVGATATKAILSEALTKGYQ